MSSNNKLKSSSSSSSIKCSICNYDIDDDDQIVESISMEKFCHLRCFRCNICKKSLITWDFEKDGQLYCYDDYYKYYGEKCKYCNNYMTGPIIVINQQFNYYQHQNQNCQQNQNELLKFHPECFKCNNCFTIIGDDESYSYIINNNKDNYISSSSILYCNNCYQKLINYPINIQLLSNNNEDEKEMKKIEKLKQNKNNLIQIITIPIKYDGSNKKRNIRLTFKDNNQHHHQQQQKPIINGNEQPINNNNKLNESIYEIDINYYNDNNDNKNILFHITDRILKINNHYIDYSNNDNDNDYIKKLFNFYSNDDIIYLYVEHNTNQKLKTTTTTATTTTTISSSTTITTTISSSSTKTTTDKQQRLYRNRERSSSLSRLLETINLNNNNNSNNNVNVNNNNNNNNDNLISDSQNKNNKCDNLQTIIVDDNDNKINNLSLTTATSTTPTTTTTASKFRNGITLASKLKSNNPLSRTKSFRVEPKSYRIFRASDLVKGALLGKGFYGEVFEVTDKVTKEKMVIKELYHNDREAETNFVREVSILKSLNHKNVLHFIGILYRGKKLNLITEYITGGTLRKLIQDENRKICWPERIGWARDISSGVNYLHSMNLIHRDLNSQNCLVREDGTVVVADFGLSKITCTNDDDDDVNDDTINRINNYNNNNDNNEKQSNNNNDVSSSTFNEKQIQKLNRRRDRRKRYTIVGHPFWMAPEMMHRDKYDERVDIYSFGIILLEIIGSVNADPDVLKRNRDFSVDKKYFFDTYINKSCPEVFWRIAFLCTELNPDMRPSSKILERWFQLLLSIYMNNNHQMLSLDYHYHYHHQIINNNNETRKFTLDELEKEVKYYNSNNIFNGNNIDNQQQQQQPQQSSTKISTNL